jgi:hypothetical protein
MSTYADIKRQIARLQAQSEELRRAEVDNVIVGIRRCFED